MRVVPKRCCLGPREHLIMGPSARCATATMSLPSSAVLYDGRHCVGRRRNVGVRTCAVWPLPKVTLKSPSRIGTAERSHRLCDHLEQPRWQRGERRGQLRAAVGRGVCLCTPLAREHHGNEHLKPLHTSADYDCCGLALVRSGVHIQPGLSALRIVRGLESKIAQHLPSGGLRTLRIRISAVRLCGSGSAGRVGGSAPVHAQRTPAQQAANRPSPREDDACGVGGAFDGEFCKGQSQINTHTKKKKTNKQTTTKNKQRRTEQRVRCGSCEQICAGTAKQTRCSMRATSAHLRRCGVP